MVIMIKLWGDLLHITCIFLQIGIIDPDCRLIGLHLYDGLFKVYSFIQLIFFGILHAIISRNSKFAIKLIFLM